MTSPIFKFDHRYRSGGSITTDSWTLTYKGSISVSYDETHKTMMLMWLDDNLSETKKEDEYCE